MPRNIKLLILGMWVVTGVAAVGLGGTLLLLRSNAAPAGHALLIADSSAGSNAGALPVLFDAPDFALSDQNGRRFTTGDLRGKVWVVDFVFTHCPGLCPLMTRSMFDLQQQTQSSSPESAVQLVSISVDPERDTPPVLKDYAQANKADESRWHFLTGTKEQTWDVSKAMKLAVQPDRGSTVMHSSHFLLVDRAGHVRGIYDFDAPGFLARLTHDASQLQRASG